MDEKHTYQGKTLSEDEIELLEHQGLVADIRNQFGSITSMLDLHRIIDGEVSETNTEEIKEWARGQLPKSVESGTDSVCHILASLDYLMTLSPDEQIKLIKGSHK